MRQVCLLLAIIVIMILSDSFASNAIQVDPLEHSFTLNAHGAYSDERFMLPKNVHVLSPHPKGFETPYTIESPSRQRTFEEIVYKNAGTIPVMSSNGWYVYKPGEKVRNVVFTPWTEREYDAWVGRVPKDDLKYVLKEENGAISPFSLVPARDFKGTGILYKGRQRFKVKVFGKTSLKEVSQLLEKKFPNEPIVIVPFTCNAKADDNGILIRITEMTRDIAEIIPGFP